MIQRSRKLRSRIELKGTLADGFARKDTKVNGQSKLGKTEKNMHICGARKSMGLFGVFHVMPFRCGKTKYHYCQVQQPDRLPLSFLQHLR